MEYARRGACLFHASHLQAVVPRNFIRSNNVIPMRFLPRISECKQTRVYGWVFLLMLGLGGVDRAHAQFISLKTAPVATGDQFHVFPADNRGMGELSIAVVDSVGDAFVNPAKAARMQGTRAFSTPMYYTVTGNDGAARTLPVGALFRMGAWFGGASVAMQELETVGPRQPVVILDQPFRSTVWPGPSPDPLLRDQSANNQYATALVGTQVTESLALAGRFFWAGLEAVDGVDLLYPRSQDINQDGHQLGVRVGVLAELDGERSAEALLLHHRMDMTHDVTYVESEWDPVTEQLLTSARTERNLDRTNTWGLHLGYVQPLNADGWRIGGVLTTNRKSHPKIPNYELMNIPRDPGTTWAYNAGVGLSRTHQQTTFGVDVIFEPIRSDTWVEAAEPISIPERDVFIDEGEKTLTNDFNFANSTVRVGARRDGAWSELQLGLQVHTIRYDLEQHDRIEQTVRDQHESWSEWTASWGAGLLLDDLEIRYQGRVTTGTGRPGVATSATFEQANFAGASDIILAPRGPLTLQDANVFTHQLSVAIPINTRSQ